MATCVVARPEAPERASPAGDQDHEPRRCDGSAVDPTRMQAPSPRPNLRLLGIAAIATVIGATSVWLLLERATGRGEVEDDPFAHVVLDEEDFEDFAQPAPSHESAAANAAAPSPRPPPLGGDASEEALPPCPDEWRDPIRLFGDAQVRPVYEQRTMLGVSIRGVKPRSFWEELGIDSDDRIVELGGEPIDSPQRSVDLMNALQSSSRIRLRLLTREGRDRWISWDAPEPPDPESLPERCRTRFAG